MEYQDIFRKFEVLFSDLIYDDIVKAIHEKTGVVALNFETLMEFDPVLSDELISNPSECLKWASDALNVTDFGYDELDRKMHFEIINLPKTENVPLSELRTRHVGKLISVKGIITKKGRVEHRITETSYECQACGEKILVIQESDKLKTPSICECGNKHSFEICKNKLEDVMQFTISSTDDDGHKSKLKALILGSLLDEKINHIKTGQNVHLTGIYDLPSFRKSDRTQVEGELKVLGLELSGDKGNLDVNNLLNSMNGYEFEDFVATIFSRKGYLTTRTSYSGDQGVDVVAEKENEKIAIQCKLHKDADFKISNSIVQKALGSAVNPTKATKAIVVCTCRFTAGAFKQAEGSKIEVELWDRERLIAEANAVFDDSEDAWDTLNRIQFGQEEEKKSKISGSLEGRVLGVMKSIQEKTGLSQGFSQNAFFSALDFLKINQTEAMRVLEKLISEKKVVKKGRSHYFLLDDSEYGIEELLVMNDVVPKAMIDILRNKTSTRISDFDSDAIITRNTIHDYLMHKGFFSKTVDVTIKSLIELGLVEEFSDGEYLLTTELLKEHGKSIS